MRIIRLYFKRNLILFFITICTVVSFGHKDSLNNKTIELKVVLSDKLITSELPPACGVFQTYNKTFKYKVIKVVNGNYKPGTILINHRCPREMAYKKLIENNKNYIFKLRPKEINPNTDQEEIVYEVLQE